MDLKLFVLVISVYTCNGIDLKGLDDSILYNIEFPGAIADAEKFEGDRLVVQSSHNEMYECVLPYVKDKEDTGNEQYKGPNAYQLLSDLFLPYWPCVYRLDTYWTYEFCHGRHIRQYHEDREGKTVKVQEYTLGKIDEAALERYAEEAEKQNTISPPTKKIDGNNLRYFEIVMGNGTLCDLNENKPRQTTVLYACYPYGKNDIYSLKETSTCQYEIIILTPLLCSHRKYKPTKTSQNFVNCLPFNNAPKKPYNLAKMQHEGKKLKNGANVDIRIEFMPVISNEKEEESKVFETSSPAEMSPVKSFLRGDTCLNGGSGWWRYEFCYGKSVTQYHTQEDGNKISINLGIFNKENHIEWLQKNPHKRPKALSARNQLSHFYSEGSVCDKTGKARQTEVKLKCLENASIHTVSLYLLEPKYCEYILGVESPLICDILKQVDVDGLVKEEPENNAKTVIKV